jgi:drug/metabolite transporter (DMT)-like permease
MSPRNPPRPVGLILQAETKAILLMLFAGLASSLMHIGVRYLAPHMPTAQVVFLRTLVTALVLLPVLLASAPQPPWHTNRLGLQILRGVVGMLSLMTWYYALGQMPLADAGALNFTTVLFVTLGAALILREPVGIRRWSAVIVGFVGMLVIVRPGSGIFSWASVVAVASSALWAASLLMSKELTKHDTSLTIAFYQPMLVAPLSFVAAAPVWVWPPAWTLVLVAVMGCLAAASNYCYVQAFRLADASVSMPVDYVRLIWMAGWGYLFFSEVPGVSTFVGAVLIMASTLFITWRESQIATERRRVAAQLETAKQEAQAT